MVALRKGVDIFGVIVLSAITTTGGGIMRDIFLLRLPPAAFLDTGYLTVATLSALCVFMLAKTNGDLYKKGSKAFDSVTNIFDALGLGTYAVMGVQTAIDCGFLGDGFFAVFIGVLTATGGGFLRDITVCEIPVILRKHFYALAACAGAVTFYILYILSFPYALSVTVSVTLTFTLRMLATRFRWNLPVAL